MAGGAPRQPVLHAETAQDPRHLQADGEDAGLARGPPGTRKRVNTQPAPPRTATIEVNMIGTPNAAASRLPTTGPPPFPKAFAVASSPNAAPRRPGGVTRIISAWIAGNIPPSAKPIAVRSTSRCQTEPISRWRGESRIVQARQPRSTGRQPKRSVTRP